MPKITADTKVGDKVQTELGEGSVWCIKDGVAEVRVVPDAETLRKMGYLAVRTVYLAIPNAEDQVSG